MRADFSGARLHQTSLKKADLRNAVFNGTFFDRCYLAEADLRGADLRQAVFFRTNLKNALIDKFTLLPFSQTEAIQRGMIFQ